MAGKRDVKRGRKSRKPSRPRSKPKLKRQGKARKTKRKPPRARRPPKLKRPLKPKREAVYPPKRGRGRKGKPGPWGFGPKGKLHRPDASEKGIPHYEQRHFDTLEKLREYLEHRPGIDGVTGYLALKPYDGEIGDLSDGWITVEEETEDPLEEFDRALDGERDTPYRDLIDAFDDGGGVVVEFEIGIVSP